WSRFNQAVCALRFLYRVTLQRPDVVTMIPYGKKPKSLPAVLSPDEVRRLFDVITQPRLLLIVQLAYGAGLRVSEVVRLQVGDIDAARMVLHIRCAKGNKDRVVPLPPVLLDSWRQHWRQHRPETWLFAGQSRGTHLCIAQVQRLFGQALRAAGITKKAGMHTLRHSYATHLLEAGPDLASLQKLLGHHHLSTPNRYIHLPQVPFPRPVSPLDTPPAAPRPQGDTLVNPPRDAGPAWGGRDAGGGVTGPWRGAGRGRPACRPPALGGRMGECSWGGRRESFDTPGPNRHCPTCQGRQRAAWLEREAGYLLPVEYHHLVFTLPQTLRPLTREQPRLIYGLLFESARQAGPQLAPHPKDPAPQPPLLPALPPL